MSAADDMRREHAAFLASMRADTRAHPRGRIARWRAARWQAGDPWARYHRERRYLRDHPDCGIVPVVPARGRS